MKHLAALILSAVISAATLTGAEAVFTPEKDYSLMMAEAVAAGDELSGLIAEQRRCEKIDAMGLEYPLYTYDELDMLARVIWLEAGSKWLTDEWRMAVGEVLLNRVASPEFPDTLAECVHQPGQYYSETDEDFTSCTPSLECAVAAARLLSGERVIGDPSVVFQSNMILGGGVHLRLSDPMLGSTYLCYTSHPELY